MKRLLPTLTLCGLVLAAAPAQAELKYSISDQWMQRPVDPPLTALPIDENLIALAKVASANVFADVSQIDLAQNVPPYAERQKMPVELYPVTAGSVIRDFTNLMALSYDRSSVDTLVFWKWPDTRHLLDLIVEHQKQMDVAAAEVDENATPTALSGYFEKNYGWKAKAETITEIQERAKGIDAAISLASLPPELRIPVETEFRAQVRHIDGAQSYRVLEMDAWKEARFTFGSGSRRDANGNVIPNQRFPYLMVSFHNQNGRSWRVGFPQFAPKEATDAAAAVSIPKAITSLKPRPSGFYKQSQVSVNLSAQLTQQVEVTEPHLDLQNEVGMQPPVAFTAKRQPLSVFVAALQKQSGVKLQLAPDTFKGSMITACSVGMKLSDAMKALERLYVAHWTKNGITYTLESDHLDEMHLALARLGVFAFYGTPRGFLTEEREELGTQIADEVLGTLNPDLMKTEQGALLSALPIELQERLFELYRNDASSSIIVAQQRLDDAMRQDVQLRFAPLAPKTPNFFGRLSTPGGDVMGLLSNGAAGLVAYTKNGQFICQLFPNFTFSNPTSSDIVLMNTKAKYEKRQAEKVAGPTGQ